MASFVPPSPNPSSFAAATSDTILVVFFSRPGVHKLQPEGHVQPTAWFCQVLFTPVHIVVVLGDRYLYVSQRQQY